MGYSKREIEFAEDNKKIWSAYINSEKRLIAQQEVDKLSVKEKTKDDQK